MYPCLISFFFFQFWFNSILETIILSFCYIHVKSSWLDLQMKWNPNLNKKNIWFDYKRNSTLVGNQKVSLLLRTNSHACSKQAWKQASKLCICIVLWWYDIFPMTLKSSFYFLIVYITCNKNLFNTLRVLSPKIRQICL